MNTYLKAEKMKYRHTFLWWLMILMPAVSAFLSAQLTHNYFAMERIIKSKTVQSGCFRQI